MEIIHKQGDVTKAEEYYILHQVNCQGVMGSGVAKAIRDKWPKVFEDYKAYYNKIKQCYPNFGLLGQVCLSIVDDHCIFNAFGQETYGRENKRYTSYDAVYDYLKYVRNCIMSNHEGPQEIAIPYKMASDRGGADWDVIMAMIISVFKDTNIKISIYHYEQVS